MMSKLKRRNFLQASTTALAAGLSPMNAALGQNIVSSPLASLRPDNPAETIPPLQANEGKKPLRLGLIIGIGKDPDAAMSKVRDLGLPTSQVFMDEFEPELVKRLRQALEKHQIEATSLVVGGPGKEVWDFYQGPLTIGLVPRETRAARIAHIKKASDFAKQCGIQAVQTHCGFIPENPNDPVYKETIAALREVVGYCRNNGQNFRYETGQETGQETPITSCAIQDVGLDNQGVNFDLANLILYGKEIPSTPLNSSARMSRESTRRMGCGRRTRGNLARRSPSARAKWIFRELSNGRGSSTIAARSPLSGRFPDRSKWRTFAMR